MKMKTKTLFKSIVSLVVTASVTLSLGVAAFAVSGTPCTDFDVGDTISAGTVIADVREDSYINIYESEQAYIDGDGPVEKIKNYDTWTAGGDYRVFRTLNGSYYYDLYLVPYSDSGDSGDSSDSPSLTPEQLRQMSVNAFVENLYERILGRTYDVTGRDYWVDQLMNQGATGADVVRGIINSQEFNPGELTEEESVLELYNDLYHRIPSAGETAVWTGALRDGASRDSVLDFFLSTPEWASICAFYQVNP